MLWALRPDSFDPPDAPRNCRKLLQGFCHIHLPLQIITCNGKKPGQAFSLLDYNLEGSILQDLRLHRLLSCCSHAVKRAVEICSRAELGPHWLLRRSHAPSLAASSTRWPSVVHVDVFLMVWLMKNRETKAPSL